MAASSSWAGLEPVQHTETHSLFSVSTSVASSLSADDSAVIASVVNALGEESATDQDLPTVITSWDKLLASPDHVIFLLRSGGEALGFCRTGPKKLFLVREKGYFECTPVCLLDVCVAATHQRKGWGKVLLDVVLQQLHLSHPRQLAFDKPSGKMLPFLAKHYALHSAGEQPNKFTVFPGFFEHMDEVQAQAKQGT